MIPNIHINSIHIKAIHIHPSINPSIHPSIHPSTHPSSSSLKSIPLNIYIYTYKYISIYIYILRSIYYPKTWNSPLFRSVLGHFWKTAGVYSRWRFSHSPTFARGRIFPWRRRNGWFWKVPSVVGQSEISFQLLLLLLPVLVPQFYPLKRRLPPNQNGAFCVAAGWMNRLVGKKQGEEVEKWKREKEEGKEDEEEEEEAEEEEEEEE